MTEGEDVPQEQAAPPRQPTHEEVEGKLVDLLPVLLDFLLVRASALLVPLLLSPFADIRTQVLQPSQMNLSNGSSRIL